MTVLTVMDFKLIYSMVVFWFWIYLFKRCFVTSLWRWYDTSFVNLFFIVLLYFSASCSIYLY